MLVRQHSNAGDLRYVPFREGESQVLDQVPIVVMRGWYLKGEPVDGGVFLRGCTTGVLSSSTSRRQVRLMAVLLNSIF